MKRRLLKYLVCPACYEGLDLMTLAASASNEIVDGSHHCARCRRTYPIARGVPRCLIDEATVPPAIQRTRRSYTFAWARFGEREIREGWEKDSAQYLSLIPKALFGGPGGVVIDAGGGGGRDLLRVAETGVEIIGVDLSGGVESAHRATAQLPNVHVVQADVHRLPSRRGTFDAGYSLGVLHHLPGPRRGFEALAAVLKPGAPLITYLYADFSDRTFGERAVLRAIRAVRVVTSRLPAPVLLGLCWLAVPAVWTLFSGPAHFLRRWQPRLAARLPFRHTLRWSVLASDLFDRFAPPMEWRYSRQTVVETYHGAGFERIETRQYRGWANGAFTRQDAAPGAAIGTRPDPAARRRH
ncbi:MAG: methyltransferase domain-containing protein [Candidatus Rokubacteria bacterium]|nr:methyltransferase domain-containing protein [Candidatus Rokubacteria bacterium]